jgi:hypothetical protein
VMTRHVDASGNGISNELEVSNAPDAFPHQPRVAANSNGDVVVVWSEYADTLEGILHVMARQYNEVGEALGDAFTVENMGTHHQFEPDVAFSGDENSFLVTWVSQDSVSTESTIRIRRFDLAGQAVLDADDLTATEMVDEWASRPRLATGQDGTGFLCWQSSLCATADASYAACCQRFYLSVFTPIGSPFSVNPSAPGTTGNPDIAQQTDGSYVITWDAYSVDGDMGAIQAQHISNQGVFLGPRIVVNRTWVGDQSKPAVTSLTGPGNPFAIFWQTREDDTAPWDTLLRILKPE